MGSKFDKLDDRTMTWLIVEADDYLREYAECIICGKPALEGKLYCKRCFEFGSKYHTNP